MQSIYLLLSLSFILLSCTDRIDAEVAQWQAQAKRVSIIRDDFGIPHIYGKTDADAVFGLLYAQCEDDFNRVEQNYIWAIGRLAEVDGEKAIYSDLRANLFMTKEEAMIAYNKSPEWLKKLCDAFADGINYYLHTHPEVKPRLLTRFEPWMAMYFSEGSIGGDIERVSTKKIEAFYEKSPTTLSMLPDRWEDEPVGSNGFAISGALTKSGNSLLLINPHTSFYFRGEVHVVSEEGLNAYGAVTWGQFFIYQGFNEHTGWMHTSTYTDVMDEFIENIAVTDSGKFYQYGSEWRKVLEKQVALAYREGKEIRKRSFPIYRTHHGPITQTIDDRWVSTAMMWEPARALEQSFTRTKKSGHQEFRKMMNIRTNSSNNTVYADSEGNIAYYHGNFIPRRDTSFDYTQPVDGTNPKTDWQGLHTVDESIVVVNPENGWIQNCNSTPFTSAAGNSPKVEDYPTYMSRNHENFRGIHAIRLLTNAQNLTLEDLIELAYDPYLPAFEKVIPNLISAYDEQNAYQELAIAIDTLRNWKFNTSKNSIGMSLAHYYGMELLQHGLPKSLNRMDGFNHLGNQLSAEARIATFQKVIATLENDFGTWQTSWGDICRFQRLTGDIKLKFDDEEASLPIGMATGRWGALASYGSRWKRDTRKIYGVSGNSFVAVVEFGKKVRAKSLLAGGQSGDPSSPHFYDQAALYADQQFKEVAFYPEDVKARAVEEYTPGNRKP